MYLCALSRERESRDSQFNVLYNKLVNYSLKFPYAEYFSFLFFFFLKSNKAKGFYYFIEQSNL